MEDWCNILLFSNHPKSVDAPNGPSQLQICEINLVFLMYNCTWRII